MPSRRLLVPLLALLMGSLLGACGQKGPLYLPQPDATDGDSSRSQQSPT